MGTPLGLTLGVGRVDRMDLFGEDWICDSCGKDPYKSSTGCLCNGNSNWRKCEPGEQGSYGRGGLQKGKKGKKKKGKSKDGPVCTCGAIRRVASKDPSRALPCSECGAGPCDVDEL